jgi:hypothetical protein
MTLAFGFASEQELGWDPTMSLTDEAQPGTMKMGDEMYIIEGIISNTRANSLLGRATRVFRVKDKTGRTFVIKDVWADDSRKREHDIQDELFQDIDDDKDWDTATKQKLKTFFFTHVKSGDVLVDNLDSPQRVKVKDTSKGFMRGLDLSGITPSYSLRPAPVEGPPQGGIGQIPSHHSSAHIDSDVASGMSELSLSKVPKVSGRPLAHRVHYRLMMAEEAQPLYDTLQINWGLGILESLVDGW